jgi:hypothetical protein
MKTYSQFIAEIEQHRREDNVLQEITQLFEHKVYKTIPGTKDTYREDPGNTNTLTMRHSHTYAGNSKNQLYAVNVDGSGHDGSSRQKIPDKHADFYRSKGYQINANNILEQLDLDDLVVGEHVIDIFLSE